jgi:hypothetical protein
VFVGSRARDAFTGHNGGSGYFGALVPVENTGGSGTIHSHWRESVFMRELMTGWISGSAQPMSRTTIESLADMGYVVDPTLADPFDIASAAVRSPEDEQRVELTGEELVTPLFKVGDDGTAVPIP